MSWEAVYDSVLSNHDSQLERRPASVIRKWRVLLAQETDCTFTSKHINVPESLILNASIDG